jgi:hypothetical protein
MTKPNLDQFSMIQSVESTMNEHAVAWGVLPAFANAQLSAFAYNIGKLYARGLCPHKPLHNVVCEDTYHGVAFCFLKSSRLLETLKIKFL